MEHVTPVNNEELAHINDQLENVNLAVPSAMSYIRKMQGWRFDQLASKLNGVSEAMWKHYLQLSYTRMRPLHVVAAYSWLTMVPMPSFYRGLNIKEVYRGMDDQSVEAMLHCAVLPKYQFQLAQECLFSYLTEIQTQRIKPFFNALYEQYGTLDHYEDKDFMFPDTLDMKDFAFDYYRSVALAFQEFREVNHLSIDTMARVLNLSVYSYKQCENPDKPVPLPVEIAARLKLGFRLQDAMPFTSYMTTYPAFHRVRRVQHIRETQLVELMRYITPAQKHEFITNLSTMVRLPMGQLHRFSFNTGGKK